MARILLLDDDPDLLAVMSELLSYRGVQCVTAHSLSELQDQRDEALIASDAGASARPQYPTAQNEAVIHRAAPFQSSARAMRWFRALL